jgi:hypothetical protein
MRKILLAILLFIGLTKLYAQPAIQWQKAVGGYQDDESYSIQQTTDGGYIVAGYAVSNDGDVTNNHGLGSDYWIVKLSDTGSIQWQKCLGGTSADRGSSIMQTSDGGYVVVGYSQSNDGDVTGHHGNSTYYDYWIVKLTGVGAIQWEKSLGGSNDDEASYIRQTNDGGYIVTGYSRSIDGDVTGHHGSVGVDDYWVVKLSSSGSLQWQKSLGGSGYDRPTCIEQTTDSGYIIAGRTNSMDGDVTGLHGGNYDYWIVKLNSSGSIQWQKCLGGTSGDFATSIQQTSNGKYIVAGYSQSTDGNITGNHGSYDYWVVKLDTIGSIEWQKSYGGASSDQAYFIRQTSDDGYIVTGTATSWAGDVTGHHGSSNNDDYWMAKLDSVGTLEWQKCLGGSGSDIGYCTQQTTDGGFIVTGSTTSQDGDVTGLHAPYLDYWIVKLEGSVGINKEWSANIFNIYPNPTTSNLTIENANSLNQITISTTDGRILKTIITPKSEIINVDVSDLSAGIYFFNCIGESGGEMVKVVKY